MKKILFIFLLFSSFCFGQGDGVKLSQIQAHRIGGVFQDSSFVMTGTNGRLRFIPLDSMIIIVNGYYDLCEQINNVPVGVLDTSEYVITSSTDDDCKRVKLSSITNGDLFTCVRVIECIEDNCEGIRECVTSIIDCEYIDSCVSLSDFDCDSVAACLDEILCDRVLACLEDSLDISDIICDAFNSFVGRAGQVGDSIIVTNGGVCAKVPFTEAMSGEFTLYTYDSACLELFMLNDSTISGTVLISADEGNGVECRVDGLFSANNCEEITTADEDVLQANDWLYINRGLLSDGCHRVPWLLGVTDCIGLSMDAGSLIADIIVDPVPPGGYSKVYCGPDGLYGDALEQDNSWLCDSLSSFDLGDSLDVGDFVIGISGAGSCKIIPVGTQVQACTQTSRNESPFWVVVQDESGTCFRITCGNFKAILDADACPN